MNESYVTIQGRLVADPDLKQTRTGIPFAAFRVASTVRRPASGGGFQDGPTSFFNVSAFRSLGANAAHSLHKGDPVTVYGRLRVNQFTRSDGTLGTTAEVDAYSVGHDLTYGTTAFEKVSRAQFGAADRLGDPNVQAAFDAQGAVPEGVVPDGPPPLSGPPALGDPETDPYEVEEGPDGPESPAVVRSDGEGDGTESAA